MYYGFARLLSARIKCGQRIGQADEHKYKSEVERSRCSRDYLSCSRQLRDRRWSSLTLRFREYCTTLFISMARSEFAKEYTFYAGNSVSRDFQMSVLFYLFLSRRDCTLGELRPMNFTWYRGCVDELSLFSQRKHSCVGFASYW